MSTDNFSNSFLKKLTSRRNNYDLFGSDLLEDLHWGKLFVHLFGKYYSRYRIRHGFNNEELIKSLICRYSLEQSQIIRIDWTKEEDLYGVNYRRSEVLLILKNELLFSIIDDKIDIMYGSNIEEAERNEVIKIVDEFKITETVVKQFHMIQYRGSFELANFDVKPFDIDVETHYNDDFQSIHSIIFDSLKTKIKMVLFYFMGSTVLVKPITCDI